MNILVAEDEKDLRELLKLNLENEGHHVRVAKNGKEALDIFEHHSIDIGLFDVMMPVLDGFNLLRRIREKSDLPIIMLTSRGDDMDKVLGFGLGADDYLVKPFSMAELMARIGVRVKKNNSMPINERSIIIGDLTLDLVSCVLYKNDMTIDLSAKEFLILKFLMENPGRVFTKKQIYTAVWEEEYLYDDNTIMVHISHLRQKIETDPKKPVVIITIKGIGYKLSKA
ncbi:MAG: DNA-binding response regulator [Firmicutes bacterium HGW-Firmicutes-2]|jgi:DNA-binding response OmpR family regulator|nr:MAG: DNA-binding response regulator [Firmicutes bacterium HGW-Firmicutes-2]